MKNVCWLRGVTWELGDDEELEDELELDPDELAAADVFGAAGLVAPELEDPIPSFNFASNSIFSARFAFSLFYILLRD